MKPFWTIPADVRLFGRALGALIALTLCVCSLTHQNAPTITIITITTHPPQKPNPPKFWTAPLRSESDTRVPRHLAFGAEAAGDTTRSRRPDEPGEVTTVRGAHVSAEAIELLPLMAGQISYKVIMSTYRPSATSFECPNPIPSNHIDIPYNSNPHFLWPANKNQFLVCSNWSFQFYVSCSCFFVLKLCARTQFSSEYLVYRCAFKGLWVARVKIL